MEQNKLHGGTLQKVFYVYGVPQDQQSLAMLENFFQQAGIKKVSRDGNIAKVVVDDKESITTMREKFRCFEGHDLSIMPELYKEFDVQLDEEWIKLMEKCCLNLKTILQGIAVQVSKTSDGVFLSGSLEDINEALKVIKGKVEAEILKHKLAIADVKTNGHGFDHVETGIHTRNEMATDISTKDSDLSKSRPNVTTTEKSIKYGTGSSDENYISKSDIHDSNDSGIAAADLGANVRRSDVPLQGSQFNSNGSGRHSRNAASSMKVNGMAEMTAAEQAGQKVAEKDPGISSVHGNKGMVDAGVVNLEDYKLQFVNHFYPDLYETLKKHPGLEENVRSERYQYMSNAVKEKSIDRLIKVTTNPKSVTSDFLRSTNVLRRLTAKDGDEVKLLVSCPSENSAVEIIGLEEDLDLLEREINQWRDEQFRKTSCKCLSLDEFKMKFIISHYPEIFKAVDKAFLVKKESKGVALILGAPAKVDEFCSWIKEFKIDLLQQVEERIPTGIDDSACKAILNSLQNEVKLHLEFPSHGKITIVGLMGDINEFLSLLKTRSEETKDATLKNLEQTTNATGAVGSVVKSGLTAAVQDFNESVESASSATVGSTASDIIHLQEFQWQFTKHFYPDQHQELQDYLKQNHEAKSKHYTHILDIIKNNSIDRVKKVIEYPKDVETSVLQRLSARLPKSLKVLVSFPSDGSMVEIIGLPEDTEKWWILLYKEIDAYKNDLAKKMPQATCIIQTHQLKFIETFYPDVCDYIKGLHVQKKSEKQICFAGTFDELDKLKKWIFRHDIDHLESKVEMMPTIVDVKECKEVLVSMQGQIKVLLSFPSSRMYEAIGLKPDIRKYQVELEQTGADKRKKLLVKSTQAAGSESDSRYLYGATSSSDKEFAFQTPLSSIQVKIAQGDLTKQKTEAIVNPCNGLLKHLGGAAKAIADAAGRDLLEDCRKYIEKHKFLNTSDVVHTSSGRLNPPIKHVIHACGPNTKEHSDIRKCQVILEKTFFNCFAYANNELHVDSLSVPAISSGTFGVPKDIVASSAWNALMQFDDQMSKTSKTKWLKFICFINIDQESTNSLIQTFKTRWNAYLFEQKSKVEAAKLEGSGQPSSTRRRSGSFSGTKSSFTDRGSANEDRNKDTSVAKRKQNHDSEESKSVNEASLQVVPRIKSGSGVQSNTSGVQSNASGVQSNASGVQSNASEAYCCVCLKRKKMANLFLRGECPHKCCTACMIGKCKQCTRSTKMESGPSSARTPVQSPNGAKKEDDAERRPESPETVISENTGTSRSRTVRRSLSVGGLNRARDVDATDLKERNERKVLSSASSSINDNQHLKKDDDCCICMDEIENPKKLDCGHIFCKYCIEKAFTRQPKCPSCGRIFGLLKGNQPSGTMTIKKEKYLDLAGYRGCGAITITYNIPDGTQTTDHPNPGMKFRGTSRTAYLPGNAEGEEVCRLLQKAFDAKLVFTIGKSNTTGHDNVVIWNDVHHKTSTVGQYGYPDPTYLQRVKDELAAKGIKSDMANAALPSSPVNNGDVSSSFNSASSKSGSATGGRSVSLYSPLGENRNSLSLPLTGAHASLNLSSPNDHYSGSPSSLLTTTGVGTSSSYLTSDVAKVHTASSTSSRSKASSSVNSPSSFPFGSGVRSTTSYHEPSGRSSSLYTSTTSSTSFSPSASGRSDYNLRSSSSDFSSASAYYRKY